MKKYFISLIVIIAYLFPLNSIASFENGRPIDAFSTVNSDPTPTTTTNSTTTSVPPSSKVNSCTATGTGLAGSGITCTATCTDPLVATCTTITCGVLGWSTCPVCSCI